MQEHDAIAMLGRIEVNVRAGIDFAGEPGELEVVGREKGEGAYLGGRRMIQRTSERQAVEGAGTAADLIHEDQTVAACVVQDVGRFGHLDHERRAAARQIVPRADTREDSVERSDRGALRRHEAADVRQDDDQGGLTHVRRLSAHVGSRDDQHAPPRIELQVVRNERARQKALDDGVPSALDLQHGLCDQSRLGPFERARTLGETRERIELRESGGRRLQRTEAVGELRQDLLEQLLLTREGAVACAQYLVLEALELGGDEALGGLHRLTPQIVLRHPLRVPSRDLDEEALHAVVAQLQSRDAGTLALAAFQLEQELVRVRRDAAQLIEIRVVTDRYDITLAQDGGRLGGDRTSQKLNDVRVLTDAREQLLQERRVDCSHLRAQCRQLHERAAQLSEIARSR